MVLRNEGESGMGFYGLVHPGGLKAATCGIHYTLEGDVPHMTTQVQQYCYNDALCTLYAVRTYLSSVGQWRK